MIQADFCWVGQACDQQTSAQSQNQKPNLQSLSIAQFLSRGSSRLLFGRNVPVDRPETLRPTDSELPQFRKEGESHNSVNLSVFSQAA